MNANNKIKEKETSFIAWGKKTIKQNTVNTVILLY